MKLLQLLLLVLASTPALAQVQVENPWSRATAPGVTVAAGYLLIRNPGAVPDRLLGASSPAAGKVEMHVTANDNGVMKMREAQGYDVPARGSFELKPGGAHLMFIDIKRPFKDGEKVSVTLKFAKSGEMKAEFLVGRIGEGAPAAPHKH